MKLYRRECRKIIDELHKQEPEIRKPRTYRKQAHKDSLNYMCSRKHTEKKTRRAIKKQLGYLYRDLGVIDNMLAKGLELSEKSIKNLRHELSRA